MPSFEMGRTICRNNEWTGYYEDVGRNVANKNQQSPLETARFMLSRPELDPDLQSSTFQPCSPGSNTRFRRNEALWCLQHSRTGRLQLRKVKAACLRAC